MAGWFKSESERRAEQRAKYEDQYKRWHAKYSQALDGLSHSDDTRAVQRLAVQEPELPAWLQGEYAREVRTTIADLSPRSANTDVIGPRQQDVEYRVVSPGYFDSAARHVAIMQESAILQHNDQFIVYKEGKLVGTFPSQAAAVQATRLLDR
jgi:hypothetical protein